MTERIMNIILLTCLLGAILNLVFTSWMDSRSEFLLSSSNSQWEQALEDRKEKDCRKSQREYTRMMDSRFYSDETAEKVYRLCLGRK